MNDRSHLNLRCAIVALALLLTLASTPVAGAQTGSGNTTGPITVGSGNTIVIGGAATGSTVTVPVCGTVTGFGAGQITVDTPGGPLTFTIPAGATINGTIPTTGRVYLLITLTDGRMTAIQVLPVDGSTGTTVNLSGAAAGVVVEGNYCSNVSVSVNNQGTVTTGSSSVANGSCTCPAPSSVPSPGATTTGAPAIVAAAGASGVTADTVHRIVRLLVF